MGEPAYCLDTLRPHQVERAYLLMHAVARDLTLADWRRTVASLFRREEIVTATNPTGVVQGVCIFRIREHVTAGRLLDIPFLVATSAGDQEGVAAVLFGYLKDRARTDGCGSIRVWSLAADNWQRMRDAAYIERWDHGVMMMVATARALH
jgi:hypothetical protein